MPNNGTKLWRKRMFFLLKTKILTLFIMLATVLHIEEYVARQGDKMSEFKKDILINETYPMLYFIAFSYWGLLWITFFRDSLKNFPWWMNFFITACMAWSSCPILILPLLSAQSSEWSKSASILILLMVIHFALAMCREPFYEFKPEDLIKWSIVGFIFSTLGIVLSVAWKSSHVDVIVAYFMLLYFIILIIIFGRTIGSVQFYVAEVEPKEWLYMILIHYNFISIYANLMFAMCKTRCVLLSDQKSYSV